MASNAEETRQVIEAYEKADAKNHVAIAAAQKHNRKLQSLYNEPKKAEVSSWSWPKLSNPFAAK